MPTESVIAAAISAELNGFQWNAQPTTFDNRLADYVLWYKGEIIGGKISIHPDEVLETVVKECIQYLKDNNLWSDQLAEQLKL